MICKLVNDFELNCVLHLVSQIQPFSILIDYGDCQTPEFVDGTVSLSTQHFGPVVPLNYSQLVSLTFTINNNFLLLNNEFKYKSTLLGFEIYGSANGTIDLAV